MSATPYYQDDTVTLYHGDALDVLSRLPDGSVDCCVTSPPYYGLRDYGIDGQYGLEATPAEFVARMVAVFAEVRRVLAADGTAWLNIGDSYYSGRGRPGPNGHDEKQPARRGWARPLDRPGQEWGTKKSLLLVPERLAIALGDEGWTVRNKIVWSKPNAMPEPVTDRLSSRWEYLFLLTRSARYWFDLDAIRTPHSEKTLRDFGDGTSNGKAYGNAKVRDNNWQPNNTTRRVDPRGANPGDVWEIATTPYPDAHFATYPLALAERCIAAGCKPGGTVLDPFSGSGTTGLAAAKHGLRYLGIDLNAEYLDLSLRTRLAQAALDFEGAAV